MTFLRALGELAGTVEQRADLRYGVGTEQCKAQGLDEVPRELVADQVAVDLDVLGHRIKLLVPATPMVAREAAELLVPPAARPPRGHDNGLHDQRLGKQQPSVIAPGGTLR